MGTSDVCEICGGSPTEEGDTEDCVLCTCPPSVAEQQDDVHGRYLVAARDLKAGELLFKEAPKSLGPRALSRPVCLGCHKQVEDQDFLRCPKCLWPLCSMACSKSVVHAAECSILARDKGKVGLPIDLSKTPRYDCIFVLRCLLLKQTNPKAWPQVLKMASHGDKLHLEKEPYHMATTQYLKKHLKLDFDLEIIHQIRGAIMANCFEWRSPTDLSLRGLYPRLALINHSCYPNVAVSSDCNGTMFARAAVDIKANSNLYITYTGINEPLWERQSYINEIHYFQCECERCNDPTELGLYYSSPKCETCKNKFLESKTWLGDTVWECPMCQKDVQDFFVKTEYAQWMSRFDCNDTFITSQPRGVRNVLEKVEFAFHPTHHVWVMAAQVAIRTLQKNDCRESLLLKKKLRKRLLKIYAVLEPGLTRRRGITLYDLGDCEANLARLERKEGRLTDHFFNIYMTEALGHLQEAIDILRLEPPLSHEQRWHKKAIEAAELALLELKVPADDVDTPPIIIAETSKAFEKDRLAVRSN